MTVSANQITAHAMASARTLVRSLLKVRDSATRKDGSPSSICLIISSRTSQANTMANENTKVTTNTNARVCAVSKSCQGNPYFRYKTIGAYMHQTVNIGTMNNGYF